jgi:hypothetical protein
MEREAVPVGRAVAFGEARLLPDVDRARAWLLTVDGAPQSYVDLDDPAHLEFEYVRRIAYTITSGLPDGPLDAVHLGGGGMTLPRWLAHERPGSRQRVVEADRELAALVAEHLPLPDPAVTVHTDDARAWLGGAADAGADLLVADVFGGSRVPAHLASVEFAREAARVLRPDGLYVANLADGAPFTFLGGQLANVREAFGGPEASVCLLAEPGVLRGRRYGNAVLAAARRPLPVDALARLCAGDAFPARVVAGAALDDLTGRPVHDGAAVPSPQPPDGAFTVG